MTIPDDGKVKKVLISVQSHSRNVEMMKSLLTRQPIKDFDKAESIRLIIKDRISKLENYLNQNGHITASNRALSYFNEGYNYKDKTGGIGYFKFLCELDKNFNDEALAELKKTADIIFDKNKLTVGVSCEKNDFDKIKNIGQIFDAKDIGNKNGISKKINIVSEGIITPSKIQYVAKAADYKKAGYEYSGKLLVLKNILDLEYCGSVRVQEEHTAADVIS